MAKVKMVRLSAPPAEKLGGVVLYRIGRGDSDLIVTFLTAENGLITALAKNARQSIRRFGGNLLQPGTAAWYYIRQKPGKTMAFVERGEVNPKAPRLPPNPICRALVAWSLELVRAFEAHENPARPTFNLLLRHFGALAKTENFSPPALLARRLSVGFTKCYLELAGFHPDLDGCVFCQRPDSDIWRLDPIAGGLVCGDCLEAQRRTSSQSPKGLIDGLRAISRHDSRPPLTEEALLAAETFYRAWASRQAGRRFKSGKVLLELLQEQPDRPDRPDKPNPPETSEPPGTPEPSEPADPTEPPGAPEPSEPTEPTEPLELPKPPELL